MSLSSSSSSSSSHRKGSLEIPKIKVPPVTTNSLKPFGEDDIDSLSDIPELNEAVNLPDKDGFSNLEVDPPVMSADFKPPPAYSSAPYSGSQSHDADDDSSQNTMIDDILITPIKTDMGTQTPKKPRLTPLHNQDELRSMDYVAPVPSQILVQDQEIEKESWLQIDVSEPYNYKIERFQGPDQISVGPLDQTHLVTPLENSHNLKFLPVKFISEHFPGSVHDENIMGAIVDSETGKIYSIECSHPNGLPKPDSKEDDADEGEAISWFSPFLLLRIVGLIVAFGALMTLILLSGPSSDEGGVAALPLRNFKRFTTFPWSTTSKIADTTSSITVPDISTTNGAFARSITSESMATQATSGETRVSEQSSSSALETTTFESSSVQITEEVTSAAREDSTTSEITPIESTLTTIAETTTTISTTSSTTTYVSVAKTDMTSATLTTKASSFDAMMETTRFEEFPNAIEDAFS